MQALSYGGIFPRPNRPHSRPILHGRRSLLITCRGNGGRGKNNGSVQRFRGKENVWSVDNDLADRSKESKKPTRIKRKRRPIRKGLMSNCLVSSAMLMESEDVLQPQEPVIIPSWSTFASSVSGIWNGVGAVFSPITAEMEPIGINNKGENLYDCYVQSRLQEIYPDGGTAVVRRKTSWASFNPFGERQRNSSAVRPISDDLPSFESFDLANSEVMEEELLCHEPGLVFFQDGSYSNGPAEIPVGEYDESKYFLSPTFKFEQCLVKGGHKRLRVIHTIEFDQGGADVQIIRVAVFEEQWVNIVNIGGDDPGKSSPNASLLKDSPLEVKPFSRQRRTRPSELAGAWKVFEVSSTMVFDRDIDDGDGDSLYLCTETIKKRSLPEEAFEHGEVTMLWLPGGVTAYVDVLPNDILCIGIGWYSDDGINLVMERDYGRDGKLKEVRYKTELKRSRSVDFDLS